MGENGNKEVVIDIVGGYKKKHPPQDDCCPICFDSFKTPCRTNCGHWFCGDCFLHLWRHTEDHKWCKCPMCGCVVKKLTPYSSKLIPPEEDRQKILNELRGYNYQNVRRWFALFLEVLIRILLPYRRLPPEGFEFRRVVICLSIYTPFNLIVVLACQLLCFGFLPSWLSEVIFFSWLYSNMLLVLIMYYLICDEIWFMLRRRATQLAPAPVPAPVPAPALHLHIQ